MITKREANKLRGLIANLRWLERQAAYAGVHPPEDADRIRRDLEQARRAVYAYIGELTA